MSMDLAKARREATRWRNQAALARDTMHSVWIGMQLSRHAREMGDVLDTLDARVRHLDKLLDAKGGV